MAPETILSATTFFKCNFPHKRTHVNLALRVYCHHQSIQLLLLTVDQLHAAVKARLKL